MVTCCACLQPSIHLGKGRKQLTTTPVQLPDTASAASQRAVFSSRDPVRANKKAGKLPIKAGTVVQCGEKSQLDWQCNMLIHARLHCLLRVTIHSTIHVKHYSQTMQYYQMVQIYITGRYWPPPPNVSQKNPKYQHPQIHIPDTNSPRYNSVKIHSGSALSRNHSVSNVISSVKPAPTHHCTPIICTTGS